jgi:hypothetical protein
MPNRRKGNRRTDELKNCRAEEQRNRGTDELKNKCTDKQRKGGQMIAG